MERTGGAYQVHDCSTREHQFLDERPSGLRLFEWDVDLHLMGENFVSLRPTTGYWNCGHTKFHIRWGQSRRSSASPSSPVSRSGTRYEVEASDTASSCFLTRSSTFDFPFFLRFGFWLFACFRGFSNATFNRSIGSSAGMYLCNISLTGPRVRCTAYLSARKANTAESIPPE